MLENEPAGTVGADAAAQDTATATPSAATRRRRAAGRPAGPPVAPPADAPPAPAEPTAGPAAGPADPDTEAAADDKPRARRTRKKAVAAVEPEVAAPAADGTVEDAPADAPAEKPKAKRTRKKAVAAEPEIEVEAEVEVAADAEVAAADADDAEDGENADPATGAAPVPPTMLLFQAPEPEPVVAPRRRTRRRAAEIAEDLDAVVEDADALAGGVEGVEEALAYLEAEDADDADDTDDTDGDEGGQARRRRRRGGRGRRGRGGRAGDGTEDSEGPAAAEGDDETAAEDTDETGEPGETGEPAGTRRRRRRRRRGEGEADTSDDPENTVTRVRSSRSASTRDRSTSDDEVTSVRGSTRLEAKKQRRREGREAGRRRVPIITEAEFLARRESVERVMVVRQGTERTQIAVLEDGVLVEHYVNKVDSTSLMGNVFLGRVQNVLPSMEAAFVDIGKGRNAVLYAGEVNFEGLEGQPKRIEHALKSGQSVLVQVTKDPVGHKGARLTSQISLPGRYLVYVPEGSMTGISRKLPDTERTRLKSILKKVVPEDAGVIIRTAAEGASEDELARDVERLAKQWEAIQKKAKTASAPALLQGEPDLTIRVVRDIFNSDFTSLVVAGDAAWDEISDYVASAAPDLVDRVSKWTADQDIFAKYRVDEQIFKALDRKVWLPSGGSLVIDRTEAMTVVDVNTGKFTGQGGNLEETVTRNNLEAAEEIVRQLRLRDIGGIIVVDFIDMVLESNRELVLRRLVECLGRDRTKHQVAEVTSLGLVQMTRKRIGQGLLEAYSHSCEHCNGRGIVVRTDHSTQEKSTVIPKPGPPGAPGPRPPLDADAPGGGRASRRRRGRGKGDIAAETREVPDEALALEAESESSEDTPVLASTDVESEAARAALATTDVDAAGEVVAAGEQPDTDADADADSDAEPDRTPAGVTVTASPDDPDAAGAEPDGAKPARRRRRATSTGKAPAKEPEPAPV